MKIKNKGFTLIELLAVIVILGLLMAIAIPSVTKYITESRKKTLSTTVGNYIGALVNDVNDLEYTFTGTNTIYAVPIECIALERGGTNPFGHWYQANNSYFAYVLIQYDDATSKYIYGFTFKDSAGYGLYPTIQANIDEKGSQVKTGYTINKPKTGELTSLVTLAKWQESGFKVDSNTHLQVLEATSENETGDGINTCTLQQKGDNYAQVEDEKYEEIEKSEANDGTLINGGSSSSVVFGYTLSKSKIEEIHTLNNKRVPADAIEWWDASVEQNKSIKAWILDNDNDEKYELYIGQNGGVTAPVNSSYLFYSYSSATNVDVSNLKTNNVTNMSYMFSFSGQVNGLGNFDTSKVTDMSYMFMLNGSKTLDLSNFNTSKVTNMLGMFSINSITSLDVSSFDTSNVTDMTSMFANSSKIETLDVSNFNTSKVTKMGGMFASCGNLKSINFGNFNTSKVTSMNNMFGGSSSLTSLDLSSFNTSNVTDMSTMFFNATSLQNINLSSFNTSKVTNMNSMFDRTTSLVSLNLSSFNTSNVVNMSQMFYGSSVGTVTTSSNFKTPKVTDWSLMFSGAQNIKITISINTTSIDAWSICFKDTANVSPAKITLNYTSSSSSNVSDIVSYCKGTHGANVVKGSRVSS